MDESRLFMKRILLTLSALIWVVAVAVGFGILCNYENSPGLAATPESQWPRSISLQLASGRDTLVMLAHPKCPCTRASLSELARIMAQCKGKVSAHVIFLKPTGEDKDWDKTDLWSSAAAIPGVLVTSDEKGVLAQSFHAQTSGQTLLFDPAGHLLFSGGITGSRGHEGDNAGHSAVVSLITTGKATLHKTFVFGCSLYNPAS